MVKDQRHMWMMGLTSQKDLQYFSKKKSSDVKMMSSKSCRRRELDSIITVECEARRPRIFTFPNQKKTSTKKQSTPQKQLFFGRVCFLGGKCFRCEKSPSSPEKTKKHSDPSPSPRPVIHSVRPKRHQRIPCQEVQRWHLSLGVGHPMASMDPRFHGLFGKEDVSRGFLFGKGPQGKKGNKNDHNNQLEEKIRGLVCCFCWWGRCNYTFEGPMCSR